MWTTVSKIGDLLEPRDRRRAFLLFGLILIMGLMEAAGVASIMPFVAVLGDPNVVATNRYLSAAYDWLGFSSTGNFLFLLGFGVFVVVVSSTALKALTTWAILH